MAFTGVCIGFDFFLLFHSGGSATSEMNLTKVIDRH